MIWCTQTTMIWLPIENWKSLWRHNWISWWHRQIFWYHYVLYKIRQCCNVHISITFGSGIMSSFMGRDVFRTLSNIYDKACNNSFRLSVVNHFHKNNHLRFLTGFLVRPWCVGELMRNEQILRNLVKQTNPKLLCLNQISIF